MTTGRFFNPPFPASPATHRDSSSNLTKRNMVCFFSWIRTRVSGVPEGQYCDARCAWLANELERADQRPTYIFMHHPPFDIGVPYVDRIKLEEPDAFVDALAAGKNIRHIFFGHVHRSVYVNWHGIPCTSLPGTNHQVPLIRESVGTSYSQEPPGYGVIFIDHSRVAMHFDACLDRMPIAQS